MVKRMEEQWIETPLGRVFSKVAGDPADPLVLGIHGWSQRNGWHTWQPLMEPVAAGGFRVVSVDMPGWGQSPKWGKAPMIGETAVRAVVAILDGLGAPVAALMGKSWGGGVALDTAMAAPERINKLILTAPAFEGSLECLAVRQPVLLVWAEDDSTIPYRYAAGYQQALPQAELVTYPTGGHSAAPNNAADFAPVAIRFLKD
jgi:pimeloyl-ACP methyl ester carboxylesterase